VKSSRSKDRPTSGAEAMAVEDDVLDLIRNLPNEINDVSTTTEFKFLTVGSVLWACHEEICRLRNLLQEKNDERHY
jgi:hypothetical protein